MPDVVITKENWQPLIDIVQKKAGKDKNGNLMPIWRCMTTYYDICHESLMQPIAYYLFNLYNRIGGTKNETFESFHRLPPKYVHACNVIDSEIQRINEYGKQ